MPQFFKSLLFTGASVLASCFIFSMVACGDEEASPPAEQSENEVDSCQATLEKMCEKACSCELGEAQFTACSFILTEGGGGVHGGVRGDGGGRTGASSRGLRHARLRVLKPGDFLRCGARMLRAAREGRLRRGA